MFEKQTKGMCKCQFHSEFDKEKDLLNRFGQEGSQGREVEGQEWDVRSEGKMTEEEGRCQILSSKPDSEATCWKEDTEYQLCKG